MINSLLPEASVCKLDSNLRLNNNCLTMSFSYNRPALQSCMEFKNGYVSLYMPPFQNPHLRTSRRQLWDFLLWKWGYYDAPQEIQIPPKEFGYPMNIPPLDPEKPLALWIGHSSFYIQIGNASFLTDPVWSQYCSPIPMRCFSRRIAPPRAIDTFPSIDFVLISHNHYDHLDHKTVQHLHALYPEILWIVPERLSSWFFRRNIKKVQELKWGDHFQQSGVTITAVPAQHFSGRGLFDRNRTHWNGYVIEMEGKRWYFSGDTGYNPSDFKEIGARWRGMDLSLIPIGTYVPRRFMGPVHVGPREAVQIHEDVQSRFSLGMHWKTFCLSDEPMDAPPYELYRAMEEKQLPWHTFLPIDPGVYVNW